MGLLWNLLFGKPGTTGNAGAFDTIEHDDDDPGCNGIEEEEESWLADEYNRSYDDPRPGHDWFSGGHCNHDDYWDDADDLGYN